ncbi:MAG: molybdopterin-guanine dinucleotide biosynthesis protein MobB [Nitrososphaerales archaeon]
MRLFGITGSTKSNRISLIEGITKELIKKDNKLAIVFSVKGKKLKFIEKEAHRFLSLGAEAVIGINTSNIFVLAKSGKILDALELVPPLDYVIAEGFDDELLTKINIGKKTLHSLASWSTGMPLDSLLSKIESLPSIKVNLTIDGKRIPLKPYVQNVITSIVKGFISTLKGYEQNARKVSLKIDLLEDSLTGQSYKDNYDKFK